MRIKPPFFKNYLTQTGQWHDQFALDTNALSPVKYPTWKQILAAYKKQIGVKIICYNHANEGGLVEIKGVPVALHEKKTICGVLIKTANGEYYEGSPQDDGWMKKVVSKKTRQ